MKSPERWVKRGLGGMAVMGLIACSADNAAQPITPTIDNNRLNVTRTLTPESQKASWDSLSPIVRLKKLLYKDYPQFEGFDRQKEVVIATAQAYCSVTKCIVSAQDLSSSVQYLEPAEFIINLQEKFKSSVMTPEEARFEIETRLAVTTYDKEKILVNQKLLKEIIEYKKSEDPNLIARLGYEDLETAFEISMLIHEFTHKNTIRNRNKFDGFSMKFPNKTDAVSFDILDEFIIEGSDSTKRPFYIMGGEEAIIDLAARMISEKRMGLKYISFDSSYETGADLIEYINSIAEMPDEEYLNYVRGNLQPSKYIEKIGSFRKKGWEKSTNFKKGVLTLAEIGIAVDGIFNIKKTEESIKSSFYK